MNLSVRLIMSKNDTIIIPVCLGYKYWTDCGYEYDCEYGNEFSCEECICVTARHDDYTGLDPRTNEKFKEQTSDAKEQLIPRPFIPNQYPLVIYESTSYKARKLVPYFIIGLLAFFSIILIWRR